MGLFALTVYAYNLKDENRRSRYLSLISLVSIIVSMAIAVLNEFWAAAPRVAFGLPVMVFAHGFMNAILTVPCFYLAIRLEGNERSVNTAAEPDVIFFDGVCVLCSKTVTLLIKLDHGKALKYSSLQGEFAQKVLISRHIGFGASVVFHSGGVSYERAEAVLHILTKLGGVYKLFGKILNLLPLFILDGLYNLIARNRYHFFGKNDSCLIPKEEDKGLFLP